MKQPRLPHLLLNNTNNPVNRSVETVIDFLKNQQSLGHTHTFLDNDARNSLRELLIRARTHKQKPSPATPAETTPETPPAVPDISLQGTSKEEKFADLKAKAAYWPPAKQLGSFRETLVFSAGNIDAELMLIGDAPGHLDEKSHQPFSGPAGQKLDGILKTMGLTREQVYLTNLAKFRPAMKRQTTNNRKPTEPEVAACLPLLLAEIELIQPAVIVTLGDLPSSALLATIDQSPALRGQWYDYLGIPLRVSHHPSHLLRSTASNHLKRALWEDMLAVMAKLNLPISEKQKAFFLPRNSH